MPRLSWVIVGPLGHEGGHKITALGPDFGKGFKQCGFVGSVAGLIYDQCRFNDSGAGLGMQPFNGKAHGLTHI